MVPIRTHITGLSCSQFSARLGFTLSVLKFIPNYVDQEKWPLVRGLLITYRGILIIASFSLSFLAIGVFSLLPPGDIDRGAIYFGLLLTALIASKDINSEINSGS